MVIVEVSHNVQVSSVGRQLCGKDYKCNTVSWLILSICKLFYRPLYIAAYSCRLLSNAVMLITLNQVTKTITSIKSQYHESSKKCFMNAIIFYSDTSLGPAIG